MECISTEDGDLYIERLSPQQYIRFIEPEERIEFSCSGAVYSFSVGEDGELSFEEASHSEYLTFAETPPVGTELIIRLSDTYSVFFDVA